MDQAEGFVALSPRELTEAITNADLREMYLDSLALIDDIVCGIIPGVPEQRFATMDGVREYVNLIARRIRHASIADSISRNVSAASSIRSQAQRAATDDEQVRQVGLAIALFRESLLDEYTKIARAYQLESGEGETAGKEW